LVECVDETIRRGHLDDATNLVPRHEPQRHVGNDAKEPISANRETKQLGVLVAAAPSQLAVRVDDCK
jgi:hypothetical protein